MLLLLFILFVYICIKESYSLEDENNDSIFLWGARQVGKTT
jgi:predicted AAA+ superfamily ATPase